MSESDIVKPESPNPDEVLAAITSFNDVSIITNIFRDLGWTYSIEIKETLALAKQNANLSIKFKAIRHLRELLREAAEASGYTASVSQTVPNTQGGLTTFRAKRIASILNPMKKIKSEIKEIENGKIKENQCNRKSNRRAGQDTGINSTESARDSRRAFPIGDVESGGTESPDGGKTSRPLSGRETDPGRKANPESDRTDNPCIKTRPPTSRGNLFPGISSAEEG